MERALSAHVKELGLALFAFVLADALQPAARTTAAFLPSEYRNDVVTFGRLGGAILFGVIACFVSFRPLAVAFVTGGAVAFLAFAFGDLSSLAWLSPLPLLICGAVEVVSYQLVLNSIANTAERGWAWWLLKDVLVWSKLLLASSLSFAFLHWGSAVMCALLLGVNLTHAEPPSPTASVGLRFALLPFVAGAAVSLALALFMVSINGPLSSTAVGGPFVIGGMAGQVVALVLACLGAMAFLRQRSTLEWTGSLLVGAALFLPWASLSDVLGLALVSGLSYGVVAAASSLLLLALARAMPRPLQPLALACSFCVGPLSDVVAESLGEGAFVLAVPRVWLALVAVALLFATGLALLKASSAGRRSLKVSPLDR